jgi:hypothetical protein
MSVISDDKKSSLTKSISKAIGSGQCICFLEILLLHFSVSEVVPFLKIESFFAQLYFFCFLFVFLIFIQLAFHCISN